MRSRRRPKGRGVPVTEIGRVEAGQGVRVLDEAGQVIQFARMGYVHV